MYSGTTATADEVLDSRNLHSKRVLVTGVPSGVGVEIARTLAAHGAVVVGTARDMAKDEAAIRSVRDIGVVELVELDLSILASVRDCADAIQNAEESLDLIVANAGVTAVPYSRTPDGFETHFATHFPGHFLLVNRLADLMRTNGHLVMVSSAGHRGADGDPDDPSFDRQEYDPLLAYRRSKTAAILFAVAFDRRHVQDGIRRPRCIREPC